MGKVCIGRTSFTRVSLRVVMLIGGHDPSGSAGVMLDSAVVRAMGCYPVAVLTAVTSQNSMGLREFLPLTPTTILSQAETLLEDIQPDAVKIGMVPNPDVVRAVSSILERTHVPVVLDTPLRAKNGAPLCTSDTVEALRNMMVPRATVVTPNAVEAGDLTRIGVHNLDSAVKAAEALVRMGAHSAVVKGGHLRECVDVLVHAGEVHIRKREKLSVSPRGTGCAFATAMACLLASGADIPEAFASAGDYVGELIGGSVKIGRGHEFLVP